MPYYYFRSAFLSSDHCLLWGFDSCPVIGWKLLRGNKFIIRDY